MVAGFLGVKKNCLLAGVIFLTMESIFQPPAVGIKYTFNFIVTGRRLAVKLGGIFKSKQNRP